MKLVVIGATGGTGSQVVGQALAAGHSNNWQAARYSKVELRIEDRSTDTR
jgi:uncharacterized protein YbjT (DUF2867 family)